MSTINEINFSDIYITPDKVAYIPDGKTANGLMKIKTDDFNYFYDKVESCYDGSNPSYSVLYNKILYRVERSVSIYGIQYPGNRQRSVARLHLRPPGFVNHSRQQRHRRHQFGHQIRLLFGHDRRPGL